MRTDEKTVRMLEERVAAGRGGEVEGKKKGCAGKELPRVHWRINCPHSDSKGVRADEGLPWRWVLMTTSLIVA